MTAKSSICSVPRPRDFLRRALGPVLSPKPAPAKPAGQDEAPPPPAASDRPA